MNILQQACLVLSRGGVILHPTETCYGFACDATRASALKKLYQLKQMSLTKPSSIMVASLEEARKYAEFSKLAEKLAREFWPGPLTLILPRKNLPDFLNPGIFSVGIRVPGHLLTLEILCDCKFPLITTSANVSGKPQAYEISEVWSQLGTERPDFYIDVGKLSGQKPSTILKILDDSFQIVREGPLKDVVLQGYSRFLLPE